MPTVAACVLLAVAGAGPGGVDMAPAEALPFDPATPLGALVAESGSTADLARLQALFRTTPANFALRGFMQPVRLAFLHPFALPEIARHVTAPVADDPAADAARPFRAIAAWAARAFGTAGAS